MQATRTEKSYQHIRRKLAAGELAPGDRLVTRMLAAEIGVSLAPVREAIGRLASEGLVKHVPGGGAFVRSLERQDVEELYVLRDAIESRAAAEAARFITDHQLDELGEICRTWRGLLEEIQSRGSATSAQFDRWLDLDTGFHQILIEAARNRLLAKVIQDYRALSQVFDIQRSRPELLDAAGAERTIADHEELLDALRNRNEARCRDLMSRQIESGRKTILSGLFARR